MHRKRGVIGKDSGVACNWRREIFLLCLYYICFSPSLPNPKCGKMYSLSLHHLCFEETGVPFCLFFLPVQKNWKEKDIEDGFLSGRNACEFIIRLLSLLSIEKDKYISLKNNLSQLKVNRRTLCEGAMGWVPRGLKGKGEVGSKQRKM